MSEHSCAKVKLIIVFSIHALYYLFNSHLMLLLPIFYFQTNIHTYIQLLAARNYVLTIHRQYQLLVQFVGTFSRMASRSAHIQRLYCWCICMCICMFVFNYVTFRAIQPICHNYSHFMTPQTTSKYIKQLLGVHVWMGVRALCLTWKVDIQCN